MINQLQAYVQQEQFKIPENLDVAAHFFSLTGVLVAMRRDYDLIGVFTLALVVGAVREELYGKYYV